MLKRICFLNFILCLLAIFVFSNPLEVQYHEYTDLATHIASGKGYVSSGFFYLKDAPSAFLQPVYSYLLAFFIRLFKLPFAYLFVRILQACVCVSMAGMIYLIGGEVFNERSALSASFIYSIYLPFAYYSTVIWDTMIFALTISLIVWLALKFAGQNIFRAVLLGFLLGISVLINSVILAFVPFLFIYWLVRFKRNFANLLVIFSLMVLVILPWSVRNSMVFRAFVPIRTGFWFNLYLGNNKDATGTVFLKQGGQIPLDYNKGITYHFRPMIKALKDLNEFEQDAYFKQRFLDQVISNPGSFVSLLFKKAYYFLWFNPYEANNLFWAFEYAFILIFAVFGFYEAYREKKRVGLFLLLFIPFTLVYSLTGPFFNWKYRLPVEPYLIVLAGYGIFKLSELLPPRWRRSL